MTPPFLTLTARALRGGGQDYREALPCAALRPFVRCFWGTQGEEMSGGPPIPVIPDACADIILEAVYDSGELSARFSGVCGTPFLPKAAPPGARRATLGIRLYFWTAHLFSSDSLRGTLDQMADARSYFERIVVPLLPLMAEPLSLDQRIAAAQDILLGLLDRKTDIETPAVRAAGILLRARGNITAASLAREAGWSERQLQRVFNDYFGATPKLLARVVRYQCVWREMVSAAPFDVQGAVLRYGYSDQPHLLREFRQFHGMPPREAIRLAGIHDATKYRLPIHTVKRL